jgi:hypothetical protein
MAASVQSVALGAWLERVDGLLAENEADPLRQELGAPSTRTEERKTRS